MRILISYLFIIFFSSPLLAQTKYYTKSGTINFKASVPSFEEVKAKNNTVTSILNIETGEIAALALVKGFRFKVALMEEHFNENYAESAKFPKATFKGIIDGFYLDSLTSKAKTFTLNGDVTFHGKTVYINPEILISKDNNIIYLESNFRISPQEFGINLPKIIQKKVAKEVTVHLNFKLQPK